MGLAGNQQPPGTTAFLAGNSIAGQSPEIDVRQQETAPSSFTTDAATLYAHLTTLDIEFNPTTFLPDSISYAIHPDANAYIDIPVQVEFSNYQTVQGVSVPFHIQRYVNGVLFLDITISRVSLS
jgi:hypothetical protein